MQVTETVCEGLKRQYKVTIAAADMASRIEARLGELQRTVRLKGFRPGKVPVDLLKRQFGKNIVGEVVQQTLRDTSGEAVTQQGVRPATQPSIEDMSFDEGQDLEYVLAFEAMPEIETGDFSGYRLENLAIQVGEDDIDKALERLRQHAKSLTDAEAGHEAGEGDAVVIDFAGTVDGEAFAGGSGQDRTVEIGGGRLLPQLEESLKGRKAGESFQVELDFPADYGASQLAGKTAVFQVEVKRVRLAELPELDEAFAKSQGVESLAELRAGLGRRLGAEYGQLARARLKRGLLDKLAAAYSFEVPPSLAEREFDAIWTQLERGQEQDQNQDQDRDRAERDDNDGDRDGASHDAASSDRGDEGNDGDRAPGEDADEKGDDGGAREQARHEYRAIAERRVRLALLLGEVARAREIEISPEQMQDAVMQRMRQFPGQEARIARYYRENPQAVRELTTPLLEELVVDDILTQVQLSERKVTLEEFFAIERAEEDATPDAGGGEGAAAPPDAATQTAATPDAASG